MDLDHGRFPISQTPYDPKLLQTENGPGQSLFLEQLIPLQTPSEHLWLGARQGLVELHSLF